MYDSIENAISDLQNSERFGCFKGKHHKCCKPCNEMPYMMQQVSPLDMNNCFNNNMPMDMNSPMMMDMNAPNMTNMNVLGMNAPMMMDMNMMGMPEDMCGCYPMAGQMVSPQMIQKPVPQCIQELYLAYPYMNPNR